MSPLSIGLIGVGLFLVLMFANMPVAFAMALIGFLGTAYLSSFEASFLQTGTIPFELISNYSWTVLPLFILMAEICFHAGLGIDLFKLAYKWLGHQPGGLATATIAACAVFSAISSSTIATAITMGLVSLPEMKKYKYDPAFATGTVAAGGTLGVLIPPSGILIIYGIITQQSIRELFMAGLIPGVILALMMMISIYVRGRINPNLGPPGPAFSFREKISAFGSCFEIIALIVVVLFGLIIGWFTPTESGAIGAFGAIVFSMLRRRLTWEGFKIAIVETLVSTGMVYAIMMGAFIFSNFLATSALPFALADIVTAFSISPIIVLILIIVVYVILGLFISAPAMVLLTVPVFFPLVTGLGWNPIWFGILITVMVEVAAITPPVAINVYVISGIAPDVPMEQIFKGIYPYLVVFLIFVIILVVFPQIALFLPELVR